MNMTNEEEELTKIIKEFIDDTCVLAFYSVAGKKNSLILYQDKNRNENSILSKDLTKRSGKQLPTEKEI